MQQPTPDPASLANLHDIVVPDPVPFWPLAPGWYGVGWMLLLVVVGFTWWRIRQWRTNRYRRVALAELDQLEAAVHDPSRRLAALGELPVLMKRVALAAWPRQAVASLSGPSLLEFLDATGPTQAFQNGPGTCLATLAYDPQAVAALDNERIASLFGAVRAWVQRHDGASRVPNLNPAPLSGSSHDHV